MSLEAAALPASERSFMHLLEQRTSGRVPMQNPNTFVSTMVVSRVTVDVLHCRIHGCQAADESSQHKEPSTVKPADLHTEPFAKTPSWAACRSTFNTTGT